MLELNALITTLKLTFIQQPVFNLLWCTCRVKVGLALAVADTLVAFEAMFEECAAMLLPVSEASLQAAWHVFR